jgi:hypothetical protein
VVEDLARLGKAGHIRRLDRAGRVALRVIFVDSQTPKSLKPKAVAIKNTRHTSSARRRAPRWHDHNAISVANLEAAIPEVKGAAL